MGEFGWRKFSSNFWMMMSRRKSPAGWDGDDYATYEKKVYDKQRLSHLLAFDTPEKASAFFDAYRQALLEKKIPDRTPIALRQKTICS